MAGSKSDQPSSLSGSDAGGTTTRSRSRTLPRVIKHVNKVPKKKYSACGPWDALKWDWTEHDVARAAAQGAHTVHNHKEVIRLKLPGSKHISRSGILTADSSFLEAWGFPLGQRDRNGRQVERLWKKNNGCEYFRDVKSFDYLQPLEETAFKQSIAGSMFGSRTNCGWTRYDHVAQREGARLSCGTHNHRDRAHPYPYDNCEIRPGLIYSKNYQKNGLAAFRNHVPKTEKEITLSQSEEIDDLEPTQQI